MHRGLGYIPLLQYYSGTSLIRTPLGPCFSGRIYRDVLFSGVIDIAWVWFSAKLDNVM